MKANVGLRNEEEVDRIKLVFRGLRDGMGMAWSRLAS